jgi:hypothetical protein
MAKTSLVNIKVNDLIYTEFVEVLSRAYGYTATVRDINGERIPNPVTAIDFVKAEIVRDVKAKYKGQKAVERPEINDPDVDGN